MSHAVYQNSTRVRVFGTFLDFNGDPDSPTTVTITVKKPDGTLLTPSVVADTNPRTGAAEPGTFYAEVLADSPGRWWARVEGDGGIDAADEGFFKVQDTNL